MVVKGVFQFRNDSEIEILFYFVAIYLVFGPHPGGTQ